MDEPERVTAECVTDEDALRIAIRELESALSDESHRGMYVESARIWIRHL